MYKVFKWIMDRLLAFIALVILFPLLAILAIVVAADSPGGPFIVQKRDGYKKKTIKVIKFRTMYSTNVAFDIDHPVVDGRNKNVTRVGRFLRASKLDELPQLVNILKGDMSFVGPRPLLPVYTPRYERWEFQKFACYPGLTGLSQVRGNGYLAVHSRSYYDVLYTEKISLFLDLKILLMTVGVVLRGEKAFLKEVEAEDIEKMKRRYQSPEGVLTVGEIVGNAKNGGVKSVVTNYLSNTDLSGLEIHIFTYGPSDADAYFAEKGWTVHYLPNFIKFPLAMRAFRKELRALHFDVVHSHLTSLSVFPLKVAKQAGVPVRICHAHSTTSPEEKTAIVKNFLKKFAPKYATALLACGKLSAEWLYGERAKDAIVLNNAIDLEKFAFSEENRKKVRKELGIGEEEFTIGCLARFEYQKNIPLLLDAFREVLAERDARLILVGSGKEQKKIEQKIKDLGIEEKVSLVPETSEPEKYYSAMDLFALTSRYEGLPVVAIEAQAAGLPCVLSSAVTKEAAIARNVRFVSGDAKAFAEAILLADRKRKQNAEKLRAAGFDVKEQAARLKEIYLSEVEKAKAQAISRKDVPKEENAEEKPVFSFSEESDSETESEKSAEDSNPTAEERGAESEGKDER